MNVTQQFTRFTYSPWVSACVQRLGLLKTMRALYAKLRARSGVAKVSLNGFEVLFSTPTPYEVRCLDRGWFTEIKMLRAIHAVLKPGDVFLDAGCNRGLFAILAARMVGPGGSVLAFEPQAAGCDRVAENVRLNKLQNVRVYKVALSDQKATRKFLVPRDEGGISPEARLYDGAYDGIDSETVEAVNYDWLVQNESFPIPRVIKMDIEGQEFAALNGMRATLTNASCVALFCEIHPDALPESVTPEQVVQLVRSLGFDTIHTEERPSQAHTEVKVSQVHLMAYK